MSSSFPHAVLTGDLIRSRQADPSDVEATFDILADAAKLFGAAFSLELRFTRHRGDGWQIVLTQPGMLLDATLYFLARLKAGQPQIATRIAIGVGPIETLGSHDLSDANGPAFYASGTRLAHMGRGDLIALTGEGFLAEHEAIIDLAGWIAAGWTKTQAEVVAMQLVDPYARHEDLAEIIGVTRQAIQNRLAGSGLSYFGNALYIMRKHQFASD